MHQQAINGGFEVSVFKDLAFPSFLKDTLIIRSVAMCML